MASMFKSLPKTLAAIIAAGILGVHSASFAATIQFDTTALADLQDLYANPVDITNVTENAAVYGKLSIDPPVDVYRFVPSEDMDQTISLQVLRDQIEGFAAAPALILVDPAAENATQQFSIPLPDDSYSLTQIKDVIPDKLSSNEPFVMKKYIVAATQTVSLKKDQTYYLIVFDTYSRTQDYVIKFGDEKAWNFAGIFTDAGNWFKVQFGSYAGVNLFAFTAGVVAVFIFLIGLITLVAGWLIHTVFALGSNRSEEAGFYLIKLQPYTRIMMWIGLWFTVMGMYMHFTQVSLIGPRFAMILALIPFATVVLIETIAHTPKLMELSVAKRQAAIPEELRKRMFICFVIGTISLIAFLLFTAMGMVQL